ncbi:hypothetical protein PBV87_08740 [Niameybacter massiliensis]|uniref:Uncharacterized protein n=1 Tax=Holtiella tumoricola TaxID=3018743 RepID=A0AA42DM83_9FIRM|nr:hypothetical protein [Holtiella tumoricola]MDA3731559.1 hypothetical protein [Holtiella tumoricola]
MDFTELKNKLYSISFSIHEHMDCSTYVGNGNDFYINFDQDPCVIKISKTLDVDLMKTKVIEIQKLLKSYNFISTVIVTDISPITKEYKITFPKN